MISSAQCIAKFGVPGGRAEGTYMKAWPVPADIQLALKHVVFSAVAATGFPTRIYCNRALTGPLEHALRSLIATGHAAELKTWDGCYIVRKQRGASSHSLHSWGLAIDVNAAANALGAKPMLSAGFVKCFTDAGFEWGGTWTRKDGMHFQLKTL
jgi:hypothetical protein